MKDVSGVAADKASSVFRHDLPLHDMTGGNTVVPEMIKELFPADVNTIALDSGVNRARRMLKMAASMEVEVLDAGDHFTAHVRVTNETGHKLPSGYPEGRRIWVNLRAKDASGNVVYESAHYDLNTGVLTHDADAKIYEIKPGIDSYMSGITDLPEGPSFHFVLNNKIFFDNRIPPRGFTNAAFEAIQSPPVDYTYADGQFWDDTQYTLPPETDTVEVRLYYQTMSKEYVEFLRDENTTNEAGNILYNLWDTHGKSAPEEMNFVAAKAVRDSDGDGISDHLDNCPDTPNPDQTDADNDTVGADCDCDDSNASITLGDTFYADTDADGFGDANSSLVECNQPAGYVANADDCDDTDSNATLTKTWYLDADHDGYGDPENTTTSCLPPPDNVDNGDDCNDEDKDVYPGAPALPDGKDNDCDGQVDKVAQSITFISIDDHPEDVGSIILEASSSSGLEIHFRLESGNAELSGSTLTILGPGTVNIVAEQEGNEAYLPATPISQTFCILPSQPRLQVILIEGIQVLISDASSNNHWYLDGMHIDEAPGDSLPVTESGYYAAQVVIEGCSSEMSVEVYIEVTGTEEITLESIKVYPNPSDGKITFELPEALQERAMHLSISDISGRYIFRKIPFDETMGRIILEMGSLDPGVYHYLILEESQGYTYRGQIILR
jgi:hypothetical protein